MHFVHLRWLIHTQKMNRGFQFSLAAGRRKCRINRPDPHRHILPNEAEIVFKDVLVVTVYIAHTVLLIFLVTLHRQRRVFHVQVHG